MVQRLARQHWGPHCQAPQPESKAALPNVLVPIVFAVTAAAATLETTILSLTKTSVELAEMSGSVCKFPPGVALLL